MQNEGEKKLSFKAKYSPHPFFFPSASSLLYKSKVCTETVPKSFMKRTLHLHFSGSCCALKFLLMAEGNNSAVRAQCSLLYLVFGLDMRRMNYRRERELMLVPLFHLFTDHETWRSLQSCKGRKHVALEIRKALIHSHLSCSRHVVAWGIVKQSKSQAKVGSKPARVAELNITGLPRDQATYQHSPRGSCGNAPGKIRLSSSGKCLLPFPQPSNVLISCLEHTHRFSQEHSPTCKNLPSYGEAKPWRVPAPGVLGLQKACQGEHGAAPTLLSPHLFHQGHPHTLGPKSKNQAAIRVRVLRSTKPDARHGPFLLSSLASPQPLCVLQKSSPWAMRQRIYEYYLVSPNPPSCTISSIP